MLKDVNYTRLFWQALIVVTIIRVLYVILFPFDLSGDDAGEHRASLAAFAPNVALANVAGLPALALPFGLADGLPVGGQLLGPVGQDRALLKLGAMVEARAPALRFPGSIAGCAA